MDTLLSKQLRSVCVMFQNLLSDCSNSSYYSHWSTTAKGYATEYLTHSPYRSNLKKKPRPKDFLLKW